MRGAAAAVGEREPASHRGEQEDLSDLSDLSDSAAPWGPNASPCLARLVVWLRAMVAQLAVFACRGLAWDLCSQEAWGKVAGRKVIVYHKQDSVISCAVIDYQLPITNYHKQDSVISCAVIAQ